LERQGPLSSADIQKVLGVSQPTVSRLLDSAGEQVIRIGKGRASRYASSHEVTQIGRIVPIYSIDTKGAPSLLGNLCPLARGQYFIEWKSSGKVPFWLAGENGEGLYDGLPYFFEGLRPGGFIGRQIGHNLAAQEGYPADPRSWNDHIFLRYAVAQGHDASGNVIIGAGALDRFLTTQVKPIKNRAKAYPHEVERIIKGGVPGSSADGEQPKFTAYTDQGHAIVKFSPTGSSPEATRWRDLLVAEHHALSTLGDAGVDSAETTIRHYAGRMFLESLRFDRAGERGRRLMLSLHAIDAEFSGLGSHWPNVVKDLLKQKLVSAQTAEQVNFIHTYGKWIGNTDMHLGNISFTVDSGKFKLLPVYDMLPMLMKPDLGNVAHRPVPIPLRTADNYQHWQATGEIAARFWQRVANDRLISDTFRELARKLHRQTIYALD
jgi:hypothetical protein